MGLNEINDEVTEHTDINKDVGSFANGTKLAHLTKLSSLCPNLKKIVCECYQFWLITFVTGSLCDQGVSFVFIYPPINNFQLKMLPVDGTSFDVKFINFKGLDRLQKKSKKGTDLKFTFCV